MTPHPPPRRDTGRGAVSTEFAVVMGVVLVSFFALAVFGGRVVQAENDVRSAAHAGARAASLEQSAAAADTAARSTVNANLSASGLVCANGLNIAVDTADFTPGGQVTVAVSCNARFSDVGSLGVPGSRTFTASATEVIDRYRSIS